MFFGENKDKLANSLKAITRLEIALVAKTSPQTVSNLFTENEDFPISSDTENRITDAMMMLIKERFNKDKILIESWEMSKRVSSHS